MGSCRTQQLCYHWMGQGDKGPGSLTSMFPNSHTSLHTAGCRALSVLSAYLEDVKSDPLTEPKQDRPTKTGMIQDMTPRW